MFHLLNICGPETHIAFLDLAVEVYFGPETTRTASLTTGSFEEFCNPGVE